MIGEMLAIEEPRERDVFTLPDNAMLLPREVAKYLNIHANTARRLMNTGELPSLVVGTRRRVRMGTLREWERKRTKSKPQR